MTTFKNTSDLAIPSNGLILVTGATGYIGANIVQEALDAGFRVRGTIRSQQKADDFVKLLKNGQKYETAIVPDMQADGAYDEAVTGVDAIIHVASITTLGYDPAEVVLPTIAAAVGIMKSALKEPNVKRFVYTSSSMAANFPKPNEKFHVDKHTWNHEAAQYADLPPPYQEEMAFPIYAASKYKAEQAVWNFAKENKVQYVINSVLPNCNFGRVITNGGVTGVWIPQIAKGTMPEGVPPQYLIDVIDDARIHVAAAIDKTLTDERIYAYDEPFNWTGVVNTLKELYPGKKFPDPDPNEGRDLSTVDNKLGAELLKKWWGQESYTGLRKTIERNMVGETV